MANKMANKRKVSWSSGSMMEILGELEETASSPCQTPLAPQLNDDGSTSKKKRGPTRCLKTHGIRYEDRFPIRLNLLGQPVGRYRATLSNYLGTLARNAHIAPLTYTSWKGLKENWEDMWETVMSKFDIEERGKKWVLQTIGSSWRSHKCRLKKKYFKPNMTADYNFKCRPPIVPIEHWRVLVKFWKSDMAKARSTKNEISRGKRTSMHTTGSKTFAEIRDEETNKNPNGREPSRVEMYILTHKPKNGKEVNDGTNRVISELEEAIALHPEASEQSTARDDIFSQVMGKDRPGHVRTYGKGVVPSDLWGTRSQLETQKVIEEVKRNAQLEIQNIEEKLQDQMQVKIKEQVEAIKIEMLGGFKMVLNQLQKHFPGVEIPDLSSISNLNINEGEAIDARSSATAPRVFAERSAGVQGLNMDGQTPPGVTSSHIVKKILRLDIPNDSYPNLLDLRDNSLKQVEATTGCRVYVRGKSSIKDLDKEELLRGRSSYEHLNDSLHVLIEAKLPSNIVDIRLRQAQEIIEELLKPVRRQTTMDGACGLQDDGLHLQVERNKYEKDKKLKKKASRLCKLRDKQRDGQKQLN